MGIFLTIKTALTHYDLRLPSGMEVRSKRHAFGMTYSLYVGTENVMTGFDGTLKQIIAVFTAGMTSEDVGGVAIVANGNGYRYRRNRRQWTPDGAYEVANDSLEYEPEDVDKFPRSAETVSELLPDYRLTLRDIFPDVFPDLPPIVYQDTDGVTEPEPIDRLMQAVIDRGTGHASREFAMFRDATVKVWPGNRGSFA